MLAMGRGDDNIEVLQGIFSCRFNVLDSAQIDVSQTKLCLFGIGKNRQALLVAQSP